MIHAYLDPDLVRVTTLFLFSLAWFAMGVGLAEEHSSRKVGQERDPEYALAISNLQRMCLGYVVVLGYFSYTYIGSALAGWQDKSTQELATTLFNYSVMFGFAAFLGGALLRLVWMCQRPDEEEKRRRRLVARQKAEYERNRR